MAIQANDDKITLVAGGYPLFANGKIIGGIGVGGGSEAQDSLIAEYVLEVFFAISALNHHYCIAFSYLAS